MHNDILWQILYKWHRDAIHNESHKTWQPQINIPICSLSEDLSGCHVSILSMWQRNGFSAYYYNIIPSYLGYRGEKMIFYFSRISQCLGTSVCGSLYIISCAFHVGIMPEQVCVYMCTRIDNLLNWLDFGVDIIWRWTLNRIELLLHVPSLFVWNSSVMFVVRDWPDCNCSS